MLTKLHPTNFVPDPEAQDVNPYASTLKLAAYTPGAEREFRGECHIERGRQHAREATAGPCARGGDDLTDLQFTHLHGCLDLKNAPNTKP